MSRSSSARNGKVMVMMMMKATMMVVVVTTVNTVTAARKSRGKSSWNEFHFCRRCNSSVTLEDGFVSCSC
jgi:hypothetical protein